MGGFGAGGDNNFHFTRSCFTRSGGLFTRFRVVRSRSRCLSLGGRFCSGGCPFLLCSTIRCFCKIFLGRFFGGCFRFGRGCGDELGRSSRLGGCVTGAVLGDEGNGQVTGLVAVGLAIITDGDRTALGGCFCCSRCGAANGACCGCEGEGSDEGLAVHFLLLLIKG